MSSIFQFLFSGEDNSEAINMLKQNVATLMANEARETSERPPPVPATQCRRNQN